MSEINIIIKETVDALVIPSNTYDSNRYVCLSPIHLPTDIRDKVQATIHGLVHDFACRFHSQGILSPLYHGKQGESCKHYDCCPYVIAHSIYLWTVSRPGFEFPDRTRMHNKELEGSGCSFKHVSEIVKDNGDIVVVNDFLETRDIVYDYLDRYNGQPFSQCIIDSAVSRAYFYYMNYVSRIIPKVQIRRKGEAPPQGPYINTMYSLNLTSKRSERPNDYRGVIVLNDCIFAMPKSDTEPIIMESMDADNDKFSYDVEGNNVLAPKKYRLYLLEHPEEEWLDDDEEELSPNEDGDDV